MPIPSPSRLRFPEDRSAFLYQGPNRPILQSPRNGLEIFSDQAATTHADIVTPDNQPIAGSVVYIGDDGLVPEFYGPSNTTRVWVRVLGSTAVYPLDAQYTSQINILPTLLSGSGAPTLDLGVEGSVYIDVASGVLYERRDGQWNEGANLTGPQGPPGSDSAQFHVHNQVVASDTWIIVHGLQFDPAVTLVDSAGNLFEADLSYPPAVPAGQVRVSIASGATAGRAICS